jgi:hypothetical protein
MKNTCIKAIALIAIAIILVSAVPFGRAQEQTQDYTSSFLLLNHPDGDTTYELNITIPQALYEYYLSKSHVLFSEADFAKFVTPYALKPIADSLWQIYNNTEDFTNGVLMLVHQITYQEVKPGRYPVETLVAGNGDCDLFAYIAASILEAGGINAVLLYYKDESHMEIGVDLDSAPTDARTQAYSINYQNVAYYVGECTSSNWRIGWRVGEYPNEFQNVSAQVITLENMEQASIGQVSASLKELDPSTLTMQISPTLTLENSPIAITGQMLPKLANENVTLQAKINSPTWTTIGTVLTQADGRFEYDWTPPTSGTVAIKASWLGNRQYNGATSAQANVILLPTFLIAVVSSAVSAVAIVAFAFIKTRTKKPAQPQPSTPQDTQPPPDPTPPPVSIAND